MQTKFNYVKPSECNIDYHNLINYAKRLENQDIPMHSLIIMRGNNICMESYYKPYDNNSLHRMFSMTKSLVSLGIGCLYGEHKLSLDDHIVDYFKDKLPQNGAYDYMKMLTIRDMLTMRTCHDSTTYKTAGITDWVGSFFTVKPVHAPGTQFSYDTSSTHVLGALIERLSGMRLIDYLKEKFLNELGFSEDTFILPDPCGIPMGGSGICARPDDMLKIIYLISKDGVYNDKQLIPADYIKAARMKQSDPYGKSGTLEEMQGYGYQIWITRNGGYALYGMAGQLALYVPDKDIYMVTTADTLGRQGGVQCIYDAFWEEIYNKIDDETSVNNETDAQLAEYNTFINSRELFCLKDSTASSYENLINNVTYVCDENVCKMTAVKVTIHNADNACTDTNNTTRKWGTITYTNETGTHSIDFGFGYNIVSEFPIYNFRCAASAVWKCDNNLLIKIQIIDSAIGNLYISLSYKDNYASVFLKKYEETFFNEFNGVFGAISSLQQTD